MSIVQWRFTRTERDAAVLTVIEVPTLVVWLRLALAGAGSASRAVLAAGIFVEEIVRFRLVRGVFPGPREIALVWLGVLVEAVGWILGLGLVPLGFPAVFVAMFLFLVAEHAVIQIATVGRVTVRDVLGFSALEAFGGSVWLVNPSVATVVIMAATSFVEHRDGLRLGADRP